MGSGTISNSNYSSNVTVSINGTIIAAIVNLLGCAASSVFYASCSATVGPSSSATVSSLVYTTAGQGDGSEVTSTISTTSNTMTISKPQQYMSKTINMPYTYLIIYSD